MRAVNLIPSDSRRTSLPSAGRSGGAAYAMVALLALAVLFVTIDVLTSNTISSRQAKLTVLNQEATNAKALASRLAPFTEFAELAQTRASTVRDIAAARFDWHAALSDLSRVVPANTSLETVNATVAPGAGAGEGSGVLRGDITAPAFELTGCSRTQDDVARLVSRLRLINGVSHVSIEDSSKAGSAAGSGSASCGASEPTFDLVVWFQPLPSAGPDGIVAAVPTATSTTPATSTTSTTSTPTTTTGSTP